MRLHWLEVVEVVRRVTAGRMVDVMLWKMSNSFGMITEETKHFLYRKTVSLRI